MPKFTVQIERALIEARIVEVEASDERKARRKDCAPTVNVASHLEGHGRVL